MLFDGFRSKIILNLVFDAVQVTLVHSHACQIQNDNPGDNYNQN
jgi:hypothetical protein